MKDCEILVSVLPDIEVTIVTKDPCDALAISGVVVRVLRAMRREPKAKVLA